MTATVTTTAKADRALAKVTKTADAARKSQALADRDRTRRDTAVLEAFEAGCTYPMLAEALDLTPDRVGQILRATRKRRDGEPG